MKYVEGDKEADGRIYDTKVNFDEPVAKERGAEFVILDVTKLDLGQE